MRKKIIVVLILTLLSLALYQWALPLGAPTESVVGYRKGGAILVEQGVPEAKQYFEETVRRTGDPRAMFGAAWTEYIDGNWERAEKTCRFLSAQTQEKVVRGHCQYLLGHIAADKGDAELAFFHLNTAWEIYTRVGLNQHLFNTSLALARVSIITQDILGAQRFLQQALEINKKAERPLDYYYVLKKKLAFQRQDYREALALSREIMAINLESGNKPGQTSSRNNILLFSMLTSQTDELDALFDVQATALSELEIDLENRYFQVCRILYKRCRNEPYQEELGEVRAWLAQRPHLELQTTLDLALTATCFQ